MSRLISGGSSIAVAGGAATIGSVSGGRSGTSIASATLASGSLTCSLPPLGVSLNTGLPSASADNDIRFSYYPSQEELLVDIADYWPVRQLQWFSRGFYSVSEREGDIVISDLRMGLEPSYAFQFKVGEISNPHPKPSVPEQIPAVRDLSLLRPIWERIWNPSVRLSPIDVSR